MLSPTMGRAFYNFITEKDLTMVTYKTKSLQEAAMLMAQTIHTVRYSGLEPVHDRHNIFKFVFELDVSDAELRELRLDYSNRKVMVEPKTYDAQLDSLRDNLNIAKS